MSKKSTNDRKKLTEKQRRFVEFYMGEANGNATKAAQLAGYKGCNNTLRAVAAQNLTKINITNAINSRIAKDPHILSREEILQRWTAMSNDEDMKPEIRIKALELLAKSYAMFVQRHEVKSEITIDDRRTKLQDQLTQSTMWDDIEKLNNSLEA